MILDGAVTSCSAKGLRPQATARTESEKEAGSIAHLALALAEACGLKPVAFFGRESRSLI